jgi:hypothetical protein
VLSGKLTTLLQIELHKDYLMYAIAIIALDALSSIAFAKLRQDGRPVKFAVVRVSSILVNVISIYFFKCLSEVVGTESRSLV